VNLALAKIVISGLIALVAIAVAVPATGSAARTDVHATGEVPIQGATGAYRLRAAYAVPGSWKRIGRKRTLRRRFGPIGSCRIRVTISGGAVADVREDAVSRASRLLPARGTGLLDYGTRTNTAYRVVRSSGTREVNALLVKPAPTVSQQPAPLVVWIELRARAVIDPRTECHAGGPRTVGQQLGDAFAAARIGGFQVIPR
jgi:hypothetical protein